MTLSQKKQDAAKEIEQAKARIAELEAILNEPEITPAQRLWQLCEGLTIKIDRAKYPNSTFFFKGDEYWFEYDAENGYLYCRYIHVWKVFENEYNLNSSEIQSLIKKQVEEHFKGLQVTPGRDGRILLYEVEEHFKGLQVTPEIKK